MNEYSRRDRKSGDAKVAGLSRSPLLRLPIRSNSLGQEKNQELLLPAASDCAWSGPIAKDERARLDQERLAQVQSISRFFHSSKKEFCPNYPSHRSLVGEWEGWGWYYASQRVGRLGNV